MDSVELLMNVTPNETRVALVETGVLKEVHIERQAKRGIVGNIYKGRVTRVLPGMQSAFVDIGLEKAAFLHASDIVSHTECVDVNEQKQFRAKSISELVREGQDIVVKHGLLALYKYSPRCHVWLDVQYEPLLKHPFPPTQRGFHWA